MELLHCGFCAEDGGTILDIWGNYSKECWRNNDQGWRQVNQAFCVINLIITFAVIN
jgi:hypothetical protein